MSDPIRTLTYHMDGTVTLWDVFRQQFVSLKAADIPARLLATLSQSERDQIAQVVATQDDPARIAAIGLQTWPVPVLAAVARGDLNLEVLARQELGNRGVNWQGKWIGVPDAQRLAKCFPVRRGDGTVIAVSAPE